MYYLYGIGAFNEVAFVAMLKSGIDTGAYGAVAPLARASCSPALSKVRWWGFSTSAGRFRPAWPRRSGAAAGAGIMFPVTNFIASLATGLVIGLAIGYIIILARKFTINQSDSTYGADVMMGRAMLPAVSWAVDYPQRDDRLDSYRHRLSDWRAAVLLWQNRLPGAPSSGRCCWAPVPDCTLI
jgi:hypothetical protein